ncbi:DoxX family protein [Cryptosporangium minutisporangium]|uniref:DoxX family protein n=1 Tax=Cryptosporangium minutisporangium TaxID=113569 RepID=A0ABP6T910_9ACTN
MDLNVWLWIVTSLLATVLLISTSKMFLPRERIAAAGGRAAEWVLDFSPGALRAIAILEFLAAAGLILPAVLDIAPVLVPVTATCVALLFVGATTMRLRRGERATIAADVLYFALAVFVAWGRFGPESFTG